MQSNIVRAALVVAVLALAAAPALQAQAPLIRTGNTEIGGFIGSSFGAGSGDFRVMGGGNVVYAASRNIMPYGEFSYFVQPLPASAFVALPASAPAKFTFSIPLTDFHGGVHIRFPVKQHPLVPYGALGVGVLHSLERKETVTIPASGGFPASTLTPTVPGQSNFAVNFGGGLRYYATERFGFRIEAKGYKPTGDIGKVVGVFGKVEFGFFYQIK